MAIHDLFSKRQKKLRGEVPDVYQYEEISEKFRIQVHYIIKDTLKNINSEVYDDVSKIFCKEHGLILENNRSAILNFLLETKNYEECLDIIELFFCEIEKISKKISEKIKIQEKEERDFESKFSEEEKKKLHGKYQIGKRFIVPINTYSIKYPNDAIDELNQRFKECGIGYEFQNGEIIRIDSQFIHSEAVKPVLVLLGNDKYYEGANQEFLKAHEHYRHKRYKECLVDCGNAFESLMKAICTKRNWTYTPKDNASKLIDICHNNNLIPSYIRSFLESGVPTIRNKKAAHGQGAEIIEVSEHLASYCLHLTASNLLFLANCEKQLP